MLSSSTPFSHTPSKPPCHTTELPNGCLRPGAGGAALVDAAAGARVAAGACLDAWMHAYAQLCTTTRTCTPMMCILPINYLLFTYYNCRSTVNHVYPLNYPFCTPPHQGPTLTPAELCQEMLRRKQEVQREKAREKEKARVEKLKQASGLVYVGMVGVFEWYICRGGKNLARLPASAAVRPPLNRSLVHEHNSSRRWPSRRGVAAGAAASTAGPAAARGAFLPLLPTIACMLRMCL